MQIYRQLAWTLLLSIRGCSGRGQSGNTRYITILKLVLLVTPLSRENVVVLPKSIIASHHPSYLYMNRFIHSAI